MSTIRIAFLYLFFLQVPRRTLALSSVRPASIYDNVVLEKSWNNSNNNIHTAAVISKPPPAKKKSRIRLRKADNTTNKTELFYACLQRFRDDREHMLLFLHEDIPYCDTEEKVARIIASYYLGLLGDNFYARILYDGNKIIGGIATLTNSIDQESLLEYWLAKPYWGRGIMTQALGEFCEDAFQDTKSRRMVAFVMDSNKASARVLEKNSFALQPGKVCAWNFGPSGPILNVYAKERESKRRL